MRQGAIKGLVGVIAAILLFADVFTGCAADTSVWRWADNLTTEAVTSVVVWNADDRGGWELDEDGIGAVIAYINALEKKNFVENKELVGITPDFGITIICGDDRYSLNESGDPRGALEMMYSGKTWWIDSDELGTFVRAQSGWEG